jgi:hypothetical protein
MERYANMETSAWFFCSLEKFLIMRGCVRCRFTHDVDAYLAAKPRDIRFPSITNISDIPPFVVGAEKDESTAVTCPWVTEIQNQDSAGVV